MWRRIGLMIGIVMTMVSLQACGRPGAQFGPQEAGFDPYPVAFRDIVQGHVHATFPRGHVLRNIIVRPPSPAWVDVEGRRLPGHAGQVDFSVKDEEQQGFRRVTYCYFLHQDNVLAFEDRDQTDWCND